MSSDLALRFIGEAYLQRPTLKKVKIETRGGGRNNREK